MNDYINDIPLQLALADNLIRSIHEKLLVYSFDVDYQCSLLGQMATAYHKRNRLLVMKLALQQVTGDIGALENRVEALECRPDSDFGIVVNIDSK